MSPPAEAPGGETRQALAAGIGCYLLWGLMPALFILMARQGATPWEILGQRALWSAPWALGLVLLAGQGGQALAVLRRPGVLAWLALSALLIGVNWATYVWAVNQGKNLEASLGYYVNPLLNMAIGGLFFRERINRTAIIAMGLAVVGVVIQAFALGRVPLVSLALAASFTGYGVIRKRVHVTAQVGLLVECLLMTAPGIAYAVWLHGHGGGLSGSGLPGALLMATAGPITVFPLVLFAWAARRLPFSILGFLQFLGPTMGFITGLVTGEVLTPLRAVSFGFIWLAAGVFMFGLWRASRQLQPIAA